MSVSTPAVVHPTLREGFRSLITDRLVFLTVVVSALGYFVDIFDLLLFTIVRVQSLKDLGVPAEKLLDKGILLINVQMAGLLLGGILWGVLGDKLGRLSVLFGSIAIYSVANIANGFVTSVPQYAALRFMGGIGLAGELGVGVTLASELLPRTSRGLGTMIIASVGVLGAAFAAYISEVTSWRTAYIVGGVLGLALLLTRVNICESGLFKKNCHQHSHVKRGNFWRLLATPDLFKRYICVILIGAPIWCTIGLFITFTPEFAKDFGMAELPTAGMAVLFCYLALSVGDFLSGVLSQKLRSRRKAVAIFMVFLLAAVILFVSFHPQTLFGYYALCTLLGLGTGYWAMFVQIGAEQFGTNLRATAATSIPNMVRGMTIPMASAFHALTPTLGVTGAGLAVMLSVLALAFSALLCLDETFATDLDYVEK